MVHSVRVYLIALVGISILLASSAFFIVMSSTSRTYRAQLEAQALENAKNLSRSVDLELQRASGILMALRASQAASTGDWQALDAQARATLTSPDVWIIVQDRSGRQLVNTRLRSGAKLPKGPAPAAMWREISTGRSRVCDLVVGFVEPRITCLDMPLTVAGERYAISMIYSPRAFRHIVTRDGVSAGHIASLVDRHGNIIWRNRNPDRFVGQAASGPVLEAIRNRIPTRVAETTSLEGVRVLTALDRSNLSGWTVVVGIPLAQIEAAQRQALWGTSLVALIALALGCLFAVFLARRLSSGVNTLTRNVATSSDPAVLTPTYIREFDEAAAAIATIQSARAEGDRRRQILIGELNHRVKNTLAIVQSLAHRTFKDAASSASALDAYDGRLRALAAAHNLLTQQSWEAAGVLQLVHAALLPFCTSERCRVDGPDLELAPQSAVSFALALHELATNASKYGALSSETGFVTAQWNADHERVHFAWTENGGPEVGEPRREGFGTKLIKRVLAADLKADVEFIYSPPGLRVLLSFPIPKQRKPTAMGDGVHITSSLVS